jgi:tRNA pseudouridine38-40 synthase
MTRIRFTVAYDGTDYCGWQRQNHGPPKSVQGVLEEALQSIFQEKIVLYASGRTDAGVHARAQVCHFDTIKPESAFEKWDFPWALKSILPPAISVKKAWIAPPDFHATLEAVHKTYRYYIFNSHRSSPFLHRYAGWIRKPVDIDHLNASSKYLLGKQDFKSFQSVGTPVKSTIREIFSAQWDRPKPHMLRFKIDGEGFLKQMVRNIVGTQLMLERLKADPADICRIIKVLDRKQAGPSVEPQGLFLWQVYYPKELDNRCREL